jgi:outer membrane protein OmpA-like peptidoglycan-associated protein
VENTALTKRIEELERLLEEYRDAKAVIDKLKLEIVRLRNENQSLAQENSFLKAENTKLRESLEEKEKSVASLSSKLLQALNDKPPVIDLTDRANFKFASGKAALTEDFKMAFNNSKDIQSIPEIVKMYQVDLIEIIGHTDAVPAPKGDSNLDSNLGRVLATSEDQLREKEISRLRYGSNADLGLMRAISVSSLLQSKLKIWGLTGIDIRCYSAAQGVIPSGPSSNSVDYYNKDAADDLRRRIEIKFTRKLVPQR